MSIWTGEVLVLRIDGDTLTYSTDGIWFQTATRNHLGTWAFVDEAETDDGKQMEVTDYRLIRESDVEVGAQWWGRVITETRLDPGFPGRPPRWYVTTETGTFQVPVRNSYVPIETFGK